MIDTFKTGFKYRFQGISPQGDLLWEQDAANLIPVPGRSYIAGRVFGSTAQIATWYMGLFGSSAYTPAYSDDMAYLVANASEVTVYDAGSRIEMVTSMPSAETWATSQSCDFTMTSAKDVYGAFIASTQAHGAATGTLLSEVKMSSPKQLETGATLRVHAQITLIT